MSMMRNKYRAKRCSSVLLPGYSFPSMLERSVAESLAARQQLGEISDLKFQQSVDLCAGIRWKIDFSYIEKGKQIYHEAKGMETADYRIKLRLYRALVPHELRISKGSAGRHKIVEVVNKQEMRTRQPTKTNLEQQ